MKTLLLAFLVVLNFNFALASSTESIELNGQGQDTLDLDLVKLVTLYRDEQRDSTCTRQEPYTVNECGYETRYKQECRYVPGYNDCRDVYDRVCRYETRYKKECRTEPGRTTCRNEPGRRVCRTNSQGREECRDIPGRQVCDTSPGRQVCRDVPYQDYVCHNVSRRQCDYVPGRNVCTNEPYQEYVCKDVTRYRDVPYACKVTVKVPYQVEQKIEHRINVEVSGYIAIADATITANLDESGDFRLSAFNRNQNSILSFTKQIQSQNENQTISLVRLVVTNKAQYLAPVRIESHGLWMSKDGSYALTVDNFMASNFDIEVDVEKISDGDTHFRKVFKVEDFKKTVKDSTKTKLEIELKNYGFKALKNLFGGVRLKVETTFRVPELSGQILGGPVDFKKTHSHKLEVYKD